MRIKAALKVAPKIDDGFAEKFVQLVLFDGHGCYLR